MRWNSVHPLTATVRVRRRPAAPWAEKTVSNFAHLHSPPSGAWETTDFAAYPAVDELAPIRAAAAAGAGWAKVLLAADWNPDLHPRGRDGKFIELFGFVNVGGLHGFQHGQRGSKQVRGQVVGITPDSGDPGNPIITVKMTDPRWDTTQFGETMDVRRDQVSAADKTKGTIPSTKPTPIDMPTPKDVPAKPTNKPPVVTDATPPPTASRPGMGNPTPIPILNPLTMPANWNEMTDEARTSWIKDTMEGDLSAWRGKPTEFSVEQMHSGIAYNMANTYRELVNWDPETAQRIDYVRTAKMEGGNVLAVADPGTDHPGGIGPVTKKVGIRLSPTHFRNPAKWNHEQSMSQSNNLPWAVDAVTGDSTFVLIHEFSHQRQFRFLNTAMKDANKPWAPAMREDGFGTVPDSSNWPETQALRYDIQELTPTQYGQSKSSEAYAESWAARIAGISSPQLDHSLDEWEVNMNLPSKFTLLGTSAKTFDQLSLEEQSEFWAIAGPMLDLPGMREHYPDAATAYDEWSQLTLFDNVQAPAAMLEVPEAVE